MNVRLSIILVVVLILVGGYVFLYEVRKVPQPKEEPPWFYDVNMMDIVRISITHEGKTVAFVREGEDWYFDDPQRSPVNLDRWSGIVLLLSGPRSNRLLAETIDDPTKYGLDPPRSIIQVSLEDGREFEIHLGDKTPDGVNQYASMVGNPGLFLITGAWGDVLVRLVTEPPYITPTPTPSSS
jgi:hypothetical protein